MTSYVTISDASDAPSENLQATNSSDTLSEGLHSSSDTLSESLHSSCVGVGVRRPSHRLCTAPLPPPLVRPASGGQACRHALSATLQRGGPPSCSGPLSVSRAAPPTVRGPSLGPGGLANLSWAGPAVQITWDHTL